MKKSIILFISSLALLILISLFIITITKKEIKIELESFEFESPSTFDFNGIKILDSTSSSPNKLNVTAKQKELYSFLLSKNGLCKDFSKEKTIDDPRSIFVYLIDGHYYCVELKNESGSLGYADVSELQLYVAGYDKEKNYAATYYFPFPFLQASCRSDEPERFEFNDSPLVKNFEELVTFYSGIRSDRYKVDENKKTIYADVYLSEYN